MAISMNPTNLLAAQNFLKQVGMAVDPASSRGVQVSVEEAQKISKAFDEIPDAGTKKAVGAALLQLIQADLFEVPSKTAKDVIAKVVGQPTDQVFSARARAEIVGGASIKSVAMATMGLLAKMPSLDKGQVEKLMGGLDKIPAEAKNLVMAVLNKSGKDNDLKFNADARAPFTKSYAKAEAQSEGSVSKLEETFTQKTHGPMEALAAQMMASPYFEDRLAALMMTICQKSMGEIDQTLRNLERDEADATRVKTKDQNTKASAKAAASSSSAAASGETPDVGATPAAGAKSQLRSSFENLVQSAAAHRADDGIITKGEATALVAKLDQIQPAEARVLQAEAMGRGLLAVGGGELMPELEPLAAWAEATTGKKLADIGDAKGLYQATTPLAETIGGSDKLENKVAAFIIEGVFGDGKAPKLAAVMQECSPLMKAMEQTVKNGDAKMPAKNGLASAIENKFANIARQAGKLPAGELGNIAERMLSKLPIPAGQKAALTAGLEAGLAAINAGAPAKQAFMASVGPMVASAAKGNAGFESLVKGPLEAARAKIAGSGVEGPAAEEALQKEFGKVKEELLAGATNHTPEEKAALSASFDATAASVAQAPAPEGASTTAPAAAPEAPEGKSDRSRQIAFEHLKIMNQQLSEMMQAMSNILNQMHQTAENAIRAIR